MPRLDRLAFADVVPCVLAMASLGEGVEALGLAAERVVRYLRAELRGADDHPACPLVRVYRTCDGRELDDAQRAAVPRPIAPDDRCIVLVASDGDEPAWRTPDGSRHHRVIHLRGPNDLEALPMIRGLVTSLGPRAEDVLWKRAGAGSLPPGHDEVDLFHVFDARGSAFVPAQEFVQRYGIASVLGIGAVLPPTDLAFAVLFSRVAIDARTAALFRTVSLGLSLSLLPAWGCERGERGAKLPPSLAAESRAFRRLLELYGETACQRISELSTTQDELLAARNLAESASKTKTEFLANMSHEIRTPLAAVIGMSELALGTDLKGEAREYVVTARRSAESLLDIVNDILDVSKIEAGQLDVEAAPFDVGGLVAFALEPLSFRAKERGAEVVARMGGGIPNRVVGDAVRVRQVLVNLVANAIKFSEGGDVIVAIERCTAPEGLRFSVTDRGVGIAPDQLARIFEPFTQADTSTKRKFGGTGLGLTICRRLVDRMGGAIGVESEVGSGSTFWFTVHAPAAPDARGEATLTGAKRPSGETVVGVAPLARRLRVLAADDNAVNRVLVSKLVEKMGHSVHVVEDGRAAVAAVAREAFDAVLMDVQMPEMDGLEATRAIRASESGGRRLPIIALTAHAMRGDEERCIEAGMDAYLTKPIDGPALATTLARLTYTPEPEAADDAGGAAPSAAAVTERAEATLDVAAAMRRIGDDASLYDELCAIVLADLPAERAAVDEGLARAAVKDVERSVHSIKGMLLNVGAVGAAELALELERAARAGHLDEVRGGLAQLDARLAEVMDALRVRTWGGPDAQLKS